MNADQIRSLQPALAALLERFRPFFARQTTFEHWHRYLAGLVGDLKRKSIEPIALAAGVPVRTLQEFLSFFVWDEDRISNALQQFVADEHGCDEAIGVLDASSHHKQGCKTPGVQRQWCGERGKSVYKKGVERCRGVSKEEVGKGPAEPDGLEHSMAVIRRIELCHGRHTQVICRRRNGS